MTNRILAFLILFINLANLQSYAIYFCNIDCGYYSTFPGTTPINSHRSIDSKTSTAGKITVKRGTTVLVSGKSVYYPGETLAYTATTPSGQQLGLTIDNGARFSNGYCQGKNRTYYNGNTLSGNIIMPTRNISLPGGGFAPQGNVRLWVEWSSYSGDTIHVSPFFVLLNSTKPSAKPTQKPTKTPTQIPTTTEPSVTNPTTVPTNSSSFETTCVNTSSPPPTQESIYMQPISQPSVTNPTEGTTMLPSSVITTIPSIFPTINNITKKHTATGNSTYVIAIYAGAIGGSVCCMIVLIYLLRPRKEKKKPLFMQIEEELHPVEIDMNITSR